MALNNVYILKDDGYKKTSAEEAAQTYKYSVSSETETFVCGTCRQGVTFVNSGERVPFFRHANSSDDCEDKIIGCASGYSKTNIIGFDLPLRVCIKDNRELNIELGFLPLTDAQMNYAEANNSSVEILDDTFTSLIGKIQINLERFSTEETIYYSLGSTISSIYRISLSSSAVYKLKTIWPQTVLGFDNKGTLFTCLENNVDKGKVIGKKVPYRGYVQVGIRYLLFIHRSMSLLYSTSMKIEKIGSFSSYDLFAIQATKFDRDTSQFFWKLGYNLNNELVKLYEVWPPCKQSTHVVWHNSDILYLYEKGNSRLKTYPSNLNSMVVKNTSFSKLYRILTTDINGYSTQQFVSAMHDMNQRYVLRYAVLNKKQLLTDVKITSAIVMDKNDKAIPFETLNELPKDQIVYIVVPYDGFIEEIRKGVIQRRIFCKSNERTEIHIVWGSKLVIYQGLDIVGVLEFIRPDERVSNNDDEIVLELEKLKGHPTSIGHDIGRIGIYLRNYPKTRQWLLKCIRIGKIDRMALKYLLRNIIRRDFK